MVISKQPEHLVTTFGLGNLLDANRRTIVSTKFMTDNRIILVNF